jgi:hypothetical protein
VAPVPEPMSATLLLAGLALARIRVTCQRKAAARAKRAVIEALENDAIPAALDDEEPVPSQWLALAAPRLAQ